MNRGDHSAFTTLYTRHKDWTFRLALRFTGDEADALDVLQDTFSYLLSKFPGFELTAKLTTFLYPAVKHNAMALKRRRKPLLMTDLQGRAPASDDESPFEPAAPPSPPDPDAASPAATASRQSNLVAILACLPAPQREVVLMRFVHDMQLTEIAAALGIPTGTVKSRLHHAMDTLRNNPLARAYFDQPPTQ